MNTKMVSKNINISRKAYQKIMKEIYSKKYGEVNFRYVLDILENEDIENAKLWQDERNCNYIDCGSFYIDDVGIWSYTY